VEVALSVSCILYIRGSGDDLRLLELSSAPSRPGLGVWPPVLASQCNGDIGKLQNAGGTVDSTFSSLFHPPTTSLLTHPLV